MVENDAAEKNTAETGATEKTVAEKPAAEKTAAGTDVVTPRSKAGGFILTLILLPLLFVGTCIPVGLVLLSTETSSRLTVPLGFTVYGIVFAWIAVRKAIQTKNDGTRLAIILAVAAMAMFGFPLLLAALL